MAQSQCSSKGNNNFCTSVGERLTEIRNNSRSVEGFITRYILDTRTVTDGERVKRMVFGEKDQRKPHKTILLVGETGVGKSTIINSIMNYMLGVESEDRIWCEIIETKENQTDFQTNTVTVYDVFTEHSPISLTTINTPGFGRTEGREEDLNITEGLLELFRSNDGVDEIDAVCLVVTSDTNEITERQLKVFNEVLSLFGNDVKKNTVVFITHAPNKPTTTIMAIKQSNVVCAQTDKGEPVYFRFNNNHCENFNDEEITKDYKSALDLLNKTMKDFLDFLKECLSMKTEIVLKTHKQVTASSTSRNDQILMAKLKQERINKISSHSRSVGGVITRYILDTRTVTDGERVKRMAFGEKDQRKPHETILLVGETGVGKSTLINSIINYMLGVESEDKIWCEINETKENQTDSQTNTVTVYDVFTEHSPISLTLIDTPGFGSTEGKEEDLNITEGLYELFRSNDGVDEIDAVCLVVKSTTNEITERQLKVFTEVLSLFGNDVEKNTVVFITHAPNKPTTTIMAIKQSNVVCAQTDKGEPVFFRFNNNHCENFNNEEIIDDYKAALDLINKTMKDFLDFRKERLSLKTEIVLKTYKQMTASSTSRKDQIPRAKLKQKQRMNKIRSSSRSVEGFITRYILNTRTVTDGKRVKRVAFGEKDQRKPHKTILLVGETGVGKSTLINSIINYMLGVESEDKIWCEIIETKGNQTKSQTDIVTVYDVFTEHSPISLTVIDTPGFGSTEGIEEDLNVTESLYELFRSNDGVDEIDAVCLVVTSVTVRLTERQLYVFNAVLSLFGNDVEKNIVVIITHASRKPANAIKSIKESGIPCAQTDKGELVYFRFDSFHCEDMNDEEIFEDYEESWKLLEKTMQSFQTFLEKSKPISVKMTVAVLRNRKQLTASISNLKDRITLTELKKQELEQTKKAFQEHENKGNIQNWEFEVDEIYKEKVPIESNLWNLGRKQATSCTVCEENCHYPGCWWVKDLSWCSVMDNKGKCTACTGKCHYTKHVKEEKVYVIKTRRVKKTKEDLKNKYDLKSAESHEIKNLISLLENEIKEQEREKIRLVEECYECVIKLEEVALTSDSVFTLQHLDFLIEKVKETGNTYRVQKLEEMKRKANNSQLARITKWIMSMYSS